ncbi:MAG: ATP synthase F1 subunit delta [Clostridiales bacterium]|nr:ATP synthase F1 subunit delta [Clostridiales bacterium]
MTETSRSYADALFSLAAETKSIPETLEALRFARNELYRTEGALDLLASPAIPKDERLSVLTKAFGDALPEHVMSLLCVMCANGCIRELDDCLTAYVELHDAAQKLSTAHVTSAVPLTDAEKAELTAQLTKKLGRTIRLVCDEDASLLGGMIVRVDGKVIDGSLKHRLQQIKEVMNS